VVFGFFTLYGPREGLPFIDSAVPRLTRFSDQPCIQPSVVIRVIELWAASKVRICARG
jgi:hypothetical protein